MLMLHISINPLESKTELYPKFSVEMVANCQHKLESSIAKRLTIPSIRNLYKLTSQDIMKYFFKKSF